MSARSILLWGRTISIRRVRLVWAAVSAHPQATIRELATVVGFEYGDVARALRVLENAGYIEHPHNVNRARRILMPYVTGPFRVLKRQKEAA